MVRKLPGLPTLPQEVGWHRFLDGVQPLTLSGKTFSLSHIYANVGSYMVTMEVTDDDGGSGSDTAVVNVKIDVTGSIFVLNSGLAGALTLTGNASIDIVSVMYAMLAAGETKRTLTEQDLELLSGDGDGGSDALRAMPIVRTTPIDGGYVPTASTVSEQHNDVLSAMFADFGRGRPLFDSPPVASAAKHRAIVGPRTDRWTDCRIEPMPVGQPESPATFVSREVRTAQVPEELDLMLGDDLNLRIDASTGELLAAGHSAGAAWRFN